MLVRKLMFLFAAIALPLGYALLIGGEFRESVAGAYCSALAIVATRPLLWIAGLAAGLVSGRWTTLVAMTIAALAISLVSSPAFDAVGITGDTELIVARLNILVIAALAGWLLRDLLAPRRLRSAFR